MNPKRLRSALIIAILLPSSLFFTLGPIQPVNAQPQNSRTIGLFFGLGNSSGWSYSGFDTNPPITVYEHTAVTMFLQSQDDSSHQLVINTPTPVSSPVMPPCCPSGSVVTFTFTTTPLEMPVGMFSYCDTTTGACGTFQVKQRGDADGDVDVDSADLATIESNLGTSLPAGWNIGDTPYPDGRVDSTDMLVVSYFLDTSGPGGPTPYDPDVNDDGVVDILDASTVALNVGASSAPPFDNPNQGPDVNYDNIVDSLDLPSPITVSITAEVAVVDDQGNVLGGAINVGDILTGTYTYESTTLDSNPLPTVGDYWHSSPPYGITVSGGGLVFQTDPGDVRFLVEIVNDHGNPISDNYLLRSYTNLPLPGGVLVDHISWQLDDPSTGALSSESLPSVPPDLSDWQSNFGLTIVGHSPTDPFTGYFVRAHVTSAFLVSDVLTFVSSSFYGGPNDQAGTGIAIAGSDAYVSGFGHNRDHAIAAKFTLPPSPGILSPVWFDTYPDQPTFPADEFFAVAVSQDSAYLAGRASPPETTDGVGGNEPKAVLAKYPLAGTAPTWVAKPNFYVYTGFEDYDAVVTALENGATFAYATGSAQSCGQDQVFVLAKYDSSGNLITRVTEPGFDFNQFPCPGGSNGNGIAILGGNVYVAGRRDGTGPTFSFADLNLPILRKYDPNLQELWTRFSSLPPELRGYFTGLTAFGGNLYAVGATYNPDIAGSTDYLVEKYDESGILLWSRNFGGGQDDILTGVVGIGNRIFAVGHTRSSGSGGSDVAVIAIDPSNGDILEETLFGGTMDDRANGAATDGTDLYVVGESRSFAEGGNEIGSNDILLLRYSIATTVDTDEDGIPDEVELSSEMQALGADPCRKTIAVEIDYLEPLDQSHTHHPGNDAINMVVDAFNRAPVPATMPCPYPGFPRETSGIGLIVDVDEAIPEDETNVALTFNPNGFQPGDTSFDTVKVAHFSLDRVPYFHYSLWVHDLDVGSTVSGIGDFHGNDFIVSLGSWEGGAPTVLQRAGTFMHELGHNLGLHHGGSDGVNFKPNYLSVMSYAFQTVGIKGADGTSRLDYSRAMLATLDENLLTEAAGIGPITDYTSWSCTGKEAELTGLGNIGLDWNCNGPVDPLPVSSDINGDRVCIKPGANGTLESANMGDDQVVGSRIHDGDNRTCESPVSGDDEEKRPVGDVQPDLLEGFEDWSAIDYTFRDNPENYPGHTNLETGHTNIETGEELTFEEAQVIEHFWEEFSSLQLAESFSSPLKFDSQGNLKVDVVLANGVVTSTNPGQVIVEITITNGGGSSLSSLRLAQALPDDWILSPFDQQVRVYFESPGHVRVELTTGVSVSVDGSPQTASLTIPDISATEARKTLDPGESIVLFVKMDYALKGTRQPAENYPIPYTTASTATVYSGVSYEGTGVQSYQSIVFVAYARVLRGGGGRASSI